MLIIRIVSVFAIGMSVAMNSTPLLSSSRRKSGSRLNLQSRAISRTALWARHWDNALSKPSR